MTAPEVAQHVDADQYGVSLDLKDAVLRLLPVVLRALSGREDELHRFLVSGNSNRRAMALADLRQAVNDGTDLLLTLSPADAADLAHDLRDAATEPDLCPRAGCERYQVACDVHGGAELVAEPDRERLSRLDVLDGVGRAG